MAIFMSSSTKDLKEKGLEIPSFNTVSLCQIWLLPSLKDLSFPAISDVISDESLISLTQHLERLTCHLVPCWGMKHKVILSVAKSHQD